MIINGCNTCLTMDLSAFRLCRVPCNSSHVTRMRQRGNHSQTVMTMTSGKQYDRAKEVKQFDDSKIGVKGLVDSGITTIPKFFVHQPETLPAINPTNMTGSDIVPIIDLSGVDSDNRATIVEQIKNASSTLGFFQITNHGVPREILDRMIDSITAFHELPTEIKSEFYRREIGPGVAYATNFDLFQAKAASWRDTIQIRLGPKMADPEMMPEVCRTAVIEWHREISRLGEVLMELLSEGLGLKKTRLKEMSCLEGKVMVGHYYPYCPEPDRTVGLGSHTDPGVLTVLHQNEVAGLQVKYGEEWVVLKPVPGAIIINIGDILQIISNEVYKSVQHRVFANPSQEARISAAIFFNPSDRESLYRPLPELVTPETPALYQQFTLTDFMTRFFTKELDGKTLTNYYKL